jgi:hypothetical protein
MATGCWSPVLRRGVARTGKRRARRSVQWLWPLMAPVGLGIVVAGGESWADPQVVSPSGLPVQVRPTYPEPGLPTFTFPQGGATLQSGAGSGTTGAQGTSGTQGSSGTGTPASTPASATTLADYQQYVGSYYGANEQCVSLTRDFDSSLPPSSQWQQGELVEGATDIAPGTPIATFNFNGAYGPSDSPGGASGVSHTGIYLGQDASGVQILDQWSGSGGASIHTIPWSSWGGNTAEAGSHYYTIK